MFLSRLFVSVHGVQVSEPVVATAWTAGSLPLYRLRDGIRLSGHSSQVVRPSTHWYSPAGHATHDAFPCALNRPTGHSLHSYSGASCHSVPGRQREHSAALSVTTPLSVPTQLTSEKVRSEQKTLTVALFESRTAASDSTV